MEAARLSAAIGKPVRINWTREEEFALDQFRPAMLIDVSAGLTASGEVAGWQYDLYHASFYPPGARSGRRSPRPSRPPTSRPCNRTCRTRAP